MRHYNNALIDQKLPCSFVTPRLDVCSSSRNHPNHPTHNTNFVHLLPRPPFRSVSIRLFHLVLQPLHTMFTLKCPSGVSVNRTVVNRSSTQYRPNAKFCFSERICFGREAGRKLRLACAEKTDPDVDLGFVDEDDAPSQEKFLSFAEILKEGERLGGKDFIFTDDSDEPVWNLEHKFQDAPIEESADVPEIKHALDPEMVDITSAYSPDQGFSEITLEDFKEKRESGEFAAVLDVRTEQEYSAGHVPGVKNIPLDTLNAESVSENGLGDLKDRPLAVICASGKRSAQATVRLTKVLGFSNVTNVQGGTNGWIERGFPVDA